MRRTAGSKAWPDFRHELPAIRFQLEGIQEFKAQTLLKGETHISAFPRALRRGVWGDHSRVRQGGDTCRGGKPTDPT